MQLLFSSMTILSTTTCKIKILKYDKLKILSVCHFFECFTNKKTKEKKYA
ncbi:hypothetical protein HMPREF9389_1253 [Streptococcus sanguinis SK355]|uniref:Uncharacterized protein n=1 Tax=Streptococcus sanguinis SK355 TaxID=888816 RepID=F3UQW5_STRSA|nr:hypothetical protein HMPREF9389_1253 [Streptococcus sanguinis SK355]